MFGVELLSHPCSSVLVRGSIPIASNLDYGGKRNRNRTLRGGLVLATLGDGQIDEVDSAVEVEIAQGVDN